jgi:protein TonB
MAPQQRNFTLALSASLLLHAILLSIHFKLPQAVMRGSENALDVILVNSKHARKPKNAQAYAQANLDGGGNSEADLRASTPLPPSPATREGDDVVAARQRVAELEMQQRQVMTRLKADASPRSRQKSARSRRRPHRRHPFPAWTWPRAHSPWRGSKHRSSGR